jgi:hypothetical protein
MGGLEDGGFDMNMANIVRPKHTLAWIKKHDHVKGKIINYILLQWLQTDLGKGLCGFNSTSLCCGVEKTLETIEEMIDKGILRLKVENKHNGKYIAYMEVYDPRFGHYQPAGKLPKVNPEGGSSNV